MIFSPLSSAISVSPAYVDAGVLESGEAYVYSFEIINRLSSSVPVNIDFELTQSSKYLENNTMFFPSSLVVNPDESNIHFSVLIVGTENITEGDHLLLFRPIPTPILQAEINASYDMNVASYILQTTVAGINFTISPADEVIVPTYSTGGTSRSSVVTLISEPMSTVEIVDETKNIMITNPWFFRVAQENETLYIKIKNMGLFNFTDLALTIAATPELDVDYDSRISSLLSGEEKTVEINMSGFSNTYHLLSIIVSDGADEWEKNVIVYVPEEPRESMSRDCIIFEPKNVTVRGSSESQINLSILNACDFSIHNLNVVVAGLNHIGHMGTIEPNKRYIFDLAVPALNDDIDYPILFIYDEGRSADVLHVDLIKTSKYLYQILFLYLALFWIYVYRAYLLSFFKNKILSKRIRVSKREQVKNKFGFPDQSEPIFNFENNRFVDGNKKNKQKR